MGTRMIPTSFLRIPQWPEPDSDELLLAVEGSALEDEVSLSCRHIKFFYISYPCKTYIYWGKKCILKIGGDENHILLSQVQ